MKLRFWGAARVVTGSMHELEVQGRRFLLDCGMFQGRREEAQQRNSGFPFPAKEVEAVLLSHAHIDHSGKLPLLYKQGFRGPIFTSPATADLCGPMLADSAALQEADASFLTRRSQRREQIGVPQMQRPPAPPLYTQEDAAGTSKLFRPVAMHTPTDIAPGLTYESFEAGHILGSTCMALTLNDGGKQVRLGFSGDLGRPGLPIVRDPEELPPVDYLILESTYGDRVHRAIQPVTDMLADIVNRTVQRRGKLIVPAFAVGRTQQIVLLLHELINGGKIPSIPMFVDSPLAVNVTEVFRRHAELFDAEASEFLRHGQDPFGFARMRYIRDATESKTLNDMPGPYMVISASGMCEAGRILHHLKHGIWDARNTVLLTGYQAENTLGSKIEQKLPQVPVFGELIPLRAEVQKLDELSGHADQNESLQWLQPLARGLKKVFLVHGEEGQQTALARAITEKYGTQVIVPAPGQEFALE